MMMTATQTHLFHEAQETVKGLWSVPKAWKDESCFIIGGGYSAKKLDLSLLKPFNVIGCNDAYIYGEEIVDICYFGDLGWYDIHWTDEVSYDDIGTFKGLKHFKNLIVTNCHDKFLEKDQETPVNPKVKVLKRMGKGINTIPSCVAWNGNTGSSAISLACHLGVKRIYLLGFDMCLTQEGSKQVANWHQNLKNPPNKDVYVKWLEYFKQIKETASMIGLEILNCSKVSRIKEFKFCEYEKAIEAERKNLK